MDGLIAGIDIGGTFTDCVVVDSGGRIFTGKAPSTPDDFSQGVVDALERVAKARDESLESLCGNLELVAHGTTVGTNTLIQKRGSKVGIITTRGHEDCIHIMRGSRGYSGRQIRQVVHYSEGPKPTPIVPKRLIEGISERIDCFGEVVAKLNEKQTVDTIKRLAGAGVDAIAVCLLWSFKNPAHERRVAELIREHAPDVFITCSADLVPKWGEYERTTAVALNAYIGPVTARYLRRIDSKLSDLGYQGALQITQCGGGTISVDQAVDAPLLTLDSGPVSGVTGSVYLGDLMGHRNVITTDMGGTSFDVGIIHDGEPEASYKSIVNQYEYFLPKVDIQAIGAGGGSLAWVDDVAKTLHVGPDSAGAVPGPICYGRGGTVPTVTDAAVVLGYFDPDNFAGGTMKLDRDAAASAIEDLGARVGLGLEACAAGICQIVEFNMADIIRRTTVQKGHDPRDFVLFAFGGAGPVHASVFARELGVQKVIVPQRHTASVWCAFGAAAADIKHILEQAELMPSPFELDTINDLLERLGADGLKLLDQDIGEDPRLEFSIDMRHRGQINEVEVPLTTGPLDENSLADTIERFYERYEVLYGKGSSFRGARLEAVTFRCRASATTRKPDLAQSDARTRPVRDEAKRPARAVYWSETRKRAETPVFDGDLLEIGNRIEGPAIVETTDTTVVVRPGQRLLVDGYGNFELDLGEMGT